MNILQFQAREEQLAALRPPKNYGIAQVSFKVGATGITAAKAEQLELYTKELLRTLDQKHWLVRLPENFLNFVLTKHGINDVLSKRHLLEAIPDGYPRPACEYFNHSVDPGSLEDAAGRIQERLASGKSLYLKPAGFFGAHGGRELVHLQPRGKDEIWIKYTNDLEPFLREQFSYDFSVHRRSERVGAVVFKGMAESRQKFLGNFISVLVGDRVVEDEIAIYPIYGRKWELRVACLAPERETQVVARFCKLGGDDFAANISLGGQSTPPEKTIAALYRDKLPHLTASQIKSLTETFIYEADGLALGVVKAVNQKLPEWFGKYATFPAQTLFVRLAAVDITGVFDPVTERVRPIIMEVQYPQFGLTPDEDCHDPITRENFIRLGAIVVQEAAQDLMKMFPSYKGIL